MEQLGYIKLHRKILENPIMLRPNYLAVWVYILLKANHKKAYLIWNNKKTTISRGSFIGSIKKISTELNVSYGSVRNILKYLKVEQQIDIKSSNKFTLFKVLNYDKYQGVDNKVITKRQQSDTNKNDKNKKNKNSKSKDLQKPIIKELKKENPITQVIDIFYQESKNNRLFSNITQRKATEDMIKAFGIDKVTEYAKYAVKCLGKEFKIQASTPLKLQQKMGEIKAKYEQEKIEKKSEYQPLCTIVKEGKLYEEYLDPNGVKKLRLKK